VLQECYKGVTIVFHRIEESVIVVVMVMVVAVVAVVAVMVLVAAVVCVALIVLRVVDKQEQCSYR
jgi:hypothetical protein